MSKLIHIVDDEANIRLSYRVALETEGYTILESPSASQALLRFANHTFDLAILDLRMPEMDGLELLAELRLRGALTPAIIITAYGDIPHAVQAIKVGAIDFLQKPLTPQQLRKVVADVISRRTLTEAAALPKAPAVHPVIPIPMPLLFAKHAINLGNFRDAHHFLGEALKQKDRPAEANYLLGVLHQTKGDEKLARESFEKALAIDPQYQPALEGLATLGQTPPPARLLEPAATRIDESLT